MGRHVMRLDALEPRALLSTSVHYVDGAAVATVAWRGHEVEVYAGRWVVQLDDFGGTLPDQQARAARMVSQKSRAFAVAHHLGADGLFLVSAPPTMDVNDAMSFFESLPGYRYAEPDFRGQLTLTPNDTRFAEMWALNNTGQQGGTFDADIDAPEAWDHETGSANVVVGVLDSGLDYTHPDLDGNVFVNTLEIPGNNLDDDGNGYVDDVRGWDFGENDNDPMGDGSHGTFVSGIIGAEGNNATGIAGVSWDLSLLALKLTPFVGSASATVAMNYALGLRTRAVDPVNLRVTNHTWAVFGYSEALNQAIAQHAAAGILAVCGASNGTNNNDVDPVYPAGYEQPNVISVGNSTRFDQRANNSNFGATSVDLFAPGTDILSTARVVDGSYDVGTGTSAATPHVAGVAALLFAAAPGATYQQVRDAILGGVDVLPALAGLCATSGRLNARGALDRLLNLPPSVTDAAYRFDERPSALAVAFSENVSASLGVNDLTLVNLTTSTTIPSENIALSYGAGDVARFTFPGYPSGVLPDGDYLATLSAAGITDAAGNPLPADVVVDFFVLAGDATRDRRVNLNDFNVLAASFGQSDRTFSQGDFTYDGMVNLDDFNILASRFGATLGPAGIGVEGRRLSGVQQRELLDDVLA